MAIDYGFDFRATSGYVTDPANCSPVLNEAYPNLYGNGATGGFEQTCADPSRDRNSAVDAQLAGNNRANIGDPVGGRKFRVDLPSAGVYDSRLAMGDASFGHATNFVNPYAEILDTTTQLFVPVAGDTSIAAEEFYDATGVKRTSAADWVSNNAVKTLTFSTTIYRLYMNEPPSVSENNCIAHLRVTTGAASGSPFPSSSYGNSPRPRRSMPTRSKFRRSPIASAVAEIKHFFTSMGVGR